MQNELKSCAGAQAALLRIMSEHITRDFWLTSPDVETEAAWDFMAAVVEAAPAATGIVACEADVTKAAVADGAAACAATVCPEIASDDDTAAAHDDATEGS